MCRDVGARHTHVSFGLGTRALLRCVAAARESAGRGRTRPLPRSVAPHRKAAGALGGQGGEACGVRDNHIEIATRFWHDVGILCYLRSVKKGRGATKDKLQSDVMLNSVLFSYRPKP